MLKMVACVGVGSCLGGIARYGLGRMLVAITGMPSLWGTFAANVTGCFLIGLFYGAFARFDIADEHWRLFFTVGFCGGFTTFSTFVHENFTALSHGRVLESVVYASLSFAIGLIMVYVGYKLISD